MSGTAVISDNFQLGTNNNNNDAGSSENEKDKNFDPPNSSEELRMEHFQLLDQCAKEEMNRDASLESSEDHSNEADENEMTADNSQQKYESPLKADHIQETDEHELQRCILGSEVINSSQDDGNSTCDAPKENNWTYILGHDQLKKRTLKNGDEGGMRPINGQSVEVRCKGVLDDGTKVDEHGNLSFTLGEEEFLLAFDLCIALMHVGEICELVTESRFAYGRTGRQPDIPPDSRITYEIELLGVKDHLPYSEQPLKERIQIGDKKRGRGNNLYEKGEYSKSINEYTRALRWLDEGGHDDDEEQTMLLIDTRIKCYNNLAAAQMKIEAWDAASTSCDQVLKVKPKNVKALFRKGKCLANLGDTKTALSYMKQVAEFSPDSKAIRREISVLERKNKAENETEKALYQKMLGTDKQPFIKPKRNKGMSWWKFYMGGAVLAALLSIGFVGYRYSHE